MPSYKIILFQWLDMVLDSEFFVANISIEQILPIQTASFSSCDKIFLRLRIIHV